MALLLMGVAEVAIVVASFAPIFVNKHRLLINIWKCSELSVAVVKFSGFQQHIVDSSLSSRP